MKTLGLLLAVTFAVSNANPYVFVDGEGCELGTVLTQSEYKARVEYTKHLQNQLIKQSEGR